MDLSWLVSLVSHERRMLPSNPFANEQRTVSKFCTGCLRQGEESHSVSIDQRHLTEFESHRRRMNLHLHHQLRKTFRVDTPTYPEKV